MDTRVFFLDCSHLIYLKFICMSEYLLISVYTLCVQVPWRAEEGVRQLEAV